MNTNPSKQDLLQQAADEDDAPAMTGGRLAKDKGKQAQLEIFTAALVDPAIKDDMASMEHPVFSLTKRADMKIRRYERNNVMLEVQPSASGIATIWDKDIMIYCGSQIVAGLNAGLRVSRRVRFVARDYLVTTNRGTSGEDYDNIERSLDRLTGTRLKTNIKTGGKETTVNFGLIDSYEIVRTNGSEGRMIAVEVTLSKWFFQALQAKEVLTLDNDYFRLTGAVERRLYEILRKHVGRQTHFVVGLDTIHQKSGSGGDIRQFRKLIKRIAGGDAPHKLLRYLVWYCAQTDQIIGASDDADGQAAVAEMIEKHPLKVRQPKAADGGEAAPAPVDPPAEDLFAAPAG